MLVAIFLLVSYFAEYPYQTESKRNETFWTKRQLGSQGSARGKARGAHNPPGRARGPWRALMGAAPLEAPPGASLAHWMSSGPKKSSRSFAAFGVRLILISCDVKNMQKIATRTGHYVNRLVPTNDIK